MRTSHRQIRKRILDAKSKISDEEFFSSRAYNGYLTDLAEAATKRYKRPLRVRVVADHDDDKVEPVGPSVDDAALAMIALRFLEGFLQKRCGVEISGSICSDLLGQKQR